MGMGKKQFLGEEMRLKRECGPKKRQFTREETVVEKRMWLEEKRIP
jgi:hypothetical protein